MHEVMRQLLEGHIDHRRALHASKMLCNTVTRSFGRAATTLTLCSSVSFSSRGSLFRSLHVEHILLEAFGEISRVVLAAPLSKRDVGLVDGSEDRLGSSLSIKYRKEECALPFRSKLADVCPERERNDSIDVKLLNCQDSVVESIVS